MFDIPHKAVQLLVDLLRIAQADGLITNQFQHVFDCGTLCVDHFAVFLALFEFHETFRQDFYPLLIDHLHARRIIVETLFQLLDLPTDFVRVDITKILAVELKRAKQPQIGQEQPAEAPLGLLDEHL